MNNKAAQAYFQTKVSTTDQGQLLLLLYDGALNFLQQAREKMLEKDYAAKGILISKVIDIVSELANTLNLEKGGNLAENLNNLYFLCTTRLLQANLKMNVEQLDSVTTILSGLRSAYAQIISTPEAQKVAAQIATKINSAGSMTQRGALITNIATAPAAIGQVQARMAYGQQAAKSGVPAPAAPVTPATPTAPVSAAPATSAALGVSTAPVSAAPQAVAPVQPAAISQAPQTVAPLASAPTVAPTPVAPAAVHVPVAAVTPAQMPVAAQAPSVPVASTSTAPATAASTSAAPATAAPATAASTTTAPAPGPAVGAGLAQGFAAPQLNRKLASYAKMG